MSGAHGPARGGIAGVAAVSLVVAVVVLALKLVAWRMTGSVVLMADSLESVVNVIAALAAVVALRIASQPADEEHPFGHGKAEYFSAGFEGALIVLAAGAIVWESIPRLFVPREPEAIAIGAAVSAVATLINGLLGWWLLRAARRFHSPALEADGHHVLSDVVTSVGALVGFGAAAASGWWILDPLFAILVAANVLRVGLDIVQRSAGGLMDTGLEPEELTAVESVIAGSMTGALELHDLRTRRAASRVFVEMHLVVPGGMTVRESHAICDRVEHALADRFADVHVNIHVEPETERHGPEE